MKIVIPGGSGQVGTMLARAFHRDGHQVIVLSRHPAPAPWSTVAWDGCSLGKWTQELEGADVVINLAGRNVNCRHHARHRHEIMESRVTSTRLMGTAISRADCPPRIWLQASTAAIYSHRFDAPHDEITGLLGGEEQGVPDNWRFCFDVAKNWEKEAYQTDIWPRTRLALLRTSIVMSPDRGGPFDWLSLLVRCGLGGRNGDGRQYVSWIHETDFVRALQWIIEHPELSGAINLASPNPLPNKEFMRLLREAHGIPVGLPSEKWMLEVAAFLLRTETELILKSRRVIPTRLLQSGFKFEFPEWRDAARDLCAQRTASRQGLKP